MKLKLVLDIETSYLDINRFRRGVGNRRRYSVLTDEVLALLDASFRLKQFHCLVLNAESDMVVATISDIGMFVDWIAVFCGHVTSIIGYNVTYDVYILYYLCYTYSVDDDVMEYLLTGCDHVCCMMSQLDTHGRLYRLEEYYNMLFGTSIGVSHDAEVDTRLTLTIYKYLLHKDDGRLVCSNLVLY